MLAHLLRRRKGGENGADDADGFFGGDGGDEDLAQRREADARRARASSARAWPVD